jgi:hypothetical protein
VVIENGGDGIPSTEATTVISPGEALKALPELVTTVCDPDVVDRLTLLEPAVTDQVVESFA